MHDKSRPALILPDISYPLRRTNDLDQEINRARRNFPKASVPGSARRYMNRLDKDIENELASLDALMARLHKK